MFLETVCLDTEDAAQTIYLTAVLALRAMKSENNSVKSISKSTEDTQ